MREPISLLPLAVAAGALVALAGLAFPEKSAGAGPPVLVPPVVVACDLRLDVVDPDPKGMNVRAKPAGPVLARIPLAAEWTEVHVTGYASDWFRIDLAETVDDDAPGGMRAVYRRRHGWVHASGLGMSELNTGEGTILRASPADSANQLRRITPDNEPKKLRVLACQGKWLRVDADGLVGWTRSWCNNQRTTCS
jgi:hypothetical protein